MKKPIKVVLDSCSSLDSSHAFMYAYQAGAKLADITVKARFTLSIYEHRLIIYFKDMEQVEKWLELCREHPEGAWPIDITHLKISKPKSSF